MGIKEQIIRAFTVELQQFLPNHTLTVRCDHGCWEVISRGKSGVKILECSLAEGLNDDNLYVYYDEDYDYHGGKPLSDPTWMSGFFDDVRRKLGYV